MTPLNACRSTSAALDERVRAVATELAAPHGIGVSRGLPTEGGVASAGRLLLWQRAGSQGNLRSRSAPRSSDGVATSVWVFCLALGRSSTLSCIGCTTTAAGAAGGCDSATSRFQQRFHVWFQQFHQARPERGWPGNRRSYDFISEWIGTHFTRSIQEAAHEVLGCPLRCDQCRAGTLHRQGARRRTERRIRRCLRHGFRRHRRAVNPPAVAGTRNGKGLKAQDAA